jgi:hypothetical protein
MGADHTAAATCRAQIDHHKPEGQMEVSRNAGDHGVLRQLLLHVRITKSLKPGFVNDQRHLWNELWN